MALPRTRALRAERGLSLLLASFVWAALGCGGARPRLPSLGVELRHEFSGLSVHGSAGQRSSVFVSLSLPDAPLPPSVVAVDEARRPGFAAAPCASGPLCAWERRARTRALLRLVRFRRGER
jgi:hypothetical protein